MQPTAKSTATRARQQIVGVGVTLDPARKPEFEQRLRTHGCTLRLFELQNRRYSYWRVEHTKSGAIQQTGFDIDIERICELLAGGAQLEHIDLCPHTASVVKSTASASAPHCVVCDSPGGLPCPAMVRDALKFGVRLAYQPGDVRLGPAHVHPGRCRKRLRQWLDTAAAPHNDRVEAKHGDR